MERIVSLLPSTTEIVCALGLGPRLVGRSHECDFPPCVEELPACTRAKLDPEAPGAEIDRRVRRLVAEGLSVYRVDAERLRELRPDVILTQEQCEVCAATPRDLEDALAEWIGARPRVVSLAPATLGDVFRDVARVAAELGAAGRGRDVVAELGARVSAIGEQTGDLAPRPRVACLEWLDPPMAAGHWMPELVRLAGGSPLFTEAGQPSAWIGLGELRDADPDLIVALPCGFDLPRTREELRGLEADPDFAALRAARAGRVALVDGNAYFNRPGPRLVDSLEILAEILHPDRFHFGHAGAAWRWLGSPTGGT
jgi:iron complex transport system substrate-binding protein